MNALQQKLDSLYLYYRRGWFILVLVGCLILAFATWRTFLSATSVYGVGVRSDLVEYLWTAENLAKGLGFGRLNGLGEFKPITHWPPFYPFLLSLLFKAGVPLLVGARYLGALLDALIIFLTGLSVARLTRSLWFSLAAALILGYSPGFWNISLDAMTEPLFLVLGLAGALCLDGYLQRHQKRWFVLSALWLGLAFLTRYAGFTFILAAALVILLDARQSRMARLKTALLFGFASVLPVFGFIIRNLIIAGSATNRYVNTIPINPADFDLLRQTLDGWIFPIRVALSIGLGKVALVIPAVCLFLGLALLAKRQSSARQIHHFSLALFYGLFIGIYPVFILISRLYFDSLITFYEERIIYPLYISILILAAFAAWWILERVGSRSIWIGAALVAVYVVTAWTFYSLYKEPRFRVLDDSRSYGRSLTSDGYFNASINSWIRDLPPGSMIFTDNLERVYFISGRYSTQINELNSKTIANIRQEVQKGSVSVVLFYSDLAKQVQVVEPAFRQIYSGADGTVLVLQNQP